MHTTHLGLSLSCQVGIDYLQFSLYPHDRKAVQGFPYPSMIEIHCRIVSIMKYLLGHRKLRPDLHKTKWVVVNATYYMVIIINKLHFKSGVIINKMNKNKRIRCGCFM